ncbi:uncharacterized protein [Onthophagus taurus]|uniref:uncharacterized protein isoform X2 n=1 Tax=Onthophagus taurus TaxID=166361 RepID=UPI0039BE7E16
MSYCWKGYTPLITAVMLVFIISTLFVIGMVTLYVLLSLSVIQYENYELENDGHVLKSLDANLDCAMACKYVAFYKGWNQLSPEKEIKADVLRKEERKPKNVEKKEFTKKGERKPEIVEKKVTLIDEEIPDDVQHDEHEVKTDDLVKDSEKLFPKEVWNEPIPRYDEEEDSPILHINKKRKLWYCPPT